MRIEPELVRALVGTLRDWGVEISLSVESDLIDEYDRFDQGLTPGPKAMSRTSDPDTSKAAARMIYPRTGTMRHRCLMHINSCGYTGATYEDVETATGIRDPWKRISELVQSGLVRPQGTRKILATGADGQVYVATALGVYMIEVKKHA